MAVLTHLTKNDLYDLDFHASRAGLRLGNFEAVDLIQTLGELIEQVEELEGDVSNLDDQVDGLEREADVLRDQIFELEESKSDLEDKVIELEQKLEKLQSSKA